MTEYERENRIAEALKLRGLKPADLAERTGISKSSISHWIKQHWQPKQKPLMTMARVLEVSEMWLAGYETPMERSKEQKNIDELAKLVNDIRKNEKLKKLCLKLSKLEDSQLDSISVLADEIAKLSARG